MAKELFHHLWQQKLVLFSANVLRVPCTCQLCCHSFAIQWILFVACLHAHKHTHAQKPKEYSEHDRKDVAIYRNFGVREYQGRKIKMEQFLAYEIHHRQSFYNVTSDLIFFTKIFGWNLIEANILSSFWLFLPSSSHSISQDQHRECVHSFVRNIFELVEYVFPSIQVEDFLATDPISIWMKGG